MAGAKESPRQKLISLMYLVLMAMIALNVSKEVLSGFGQVNEKITLSTDAVITSNLEEYGKLPKEAADVSELKKRSDALYEGIEEVKQMVVGSFKENPLEEKNYEVMDASDALDTYFFSPTGVSDAGQEFLDELNSYRAFAGGFIAPIDEKQVSIVDERFNTTDVKNKEGLPQSWLSYHYEGFPLISSVAKLTLIQNSIRQTEKDFIAAINKKFLSENLDERTEELSDEISLSKILRPSIVPTKMNVVYRGIDNPLDIVVPGVHPDKVSVQAAGLRRVKGSNYILKPGKGKTVTVNVSGKLSDGTPIVSKQMFRI